MGNKINKKKLLKGFTLVELLATIAILSIVAVGGFYAINSAIKTSKEKTAIVTTKLLKDTSRIYIEEYKQDSKYWFVDTENFNLEYSCTKIGTLIDKGYFKSDIIGTTIGEDRVTTDTSIMIRRNKSNKTYYDEILFNQKPCMENGEINFTYEVSGTEGDNEWYNSDVDVTILPDDTNSSQIDKYTKLYITNDGETKEINLSTSLTLSEKIYTSISDNGSNIDLCIDLLTTKENSKTYCLSNKNGSLKIDTGAPDITNIKVAFNNDILTINDVTDNLTKNENIRYEVLNNNNTVSESNGSISTLISDKNNYKDEQSINIKVKDDAGNASDVTKKILIVDSKNSAVVPTKKYFCSLDNEAYETLESATVACDKSGTVTNKTEYYCSLTSQYYSTNSAAVTACTKKGSVSPSTDYYCSLTSQYYSTNAAAVTACTNKGSVKSSTDYYCSLTGKYYSTYTNAVTACTNKGSVSPSTDYYCSLTGKYYSTSSKATSACDASGTVSSKTTYSCDLNSTIYTSQSAATSGCKKTTKGSITTYYYCGSSKSNSSTCTERKNEAGSVECSYECKKGKWEYSTRLSGTTNKQCSSLGSDWKKTAWICSPTSCPPASSQACTSGQTSDPYSRLTCYNACSRTYYATTKYWCSATKSYVSSASSTCSKTTNGTTASSTKYYCSLTSSAYSSSSAATTACTKVGTVSPRTQYYCSLTGQYYSTQSLANSACDKSQTPTSRIRYYCSLTGQYYSTQPLANSACDKSKTPTSRTQYYCSLTGQYYSTQSLANSACDKSQTPTSRTQYFCSLSGTTAYTTNNAAAAACTKVGTTSNETKYYCDLTNEYYLTNSDATTKCTNYCQKGQYYSNSCYYVGE